MEILIEDLEKIKLSPSLIALLKVINNKDNKYLIELNNVANVFKMANWLQERMILKIISKELLCSSFEIRQLDMIKYLNNEKYSNSLERDIDNIINYFKTITHKSRISLKSKSSRKFIKARLQEYEVQDLKDVIDLKYTQWKADPVMRAYIRISTIMNEEKFQGYIGELESSDLKEFSDDI